MAKDKIVNDAQTNKTFNFEGKGVRLSFTLNVDNTKELKAFDELLVLAREKITNELANFLK